MLRPTLVFFLMTLAVWASTAVGAPTRPDTRSDGPPYKTTFVTVQPGVKLQVVEWGGSGSPMIFLPGLNATAHAFDNFAPKFTANHVVYGITRRGTPPSSIPAPTDANYDANRLGDDVLAVIDALKISRPVLVGESIAGQELSSIGTRFPNRIAGLVYLDATGPFAYYVPDSSAMAVDVATVRRDLTQLPKEARSPSQSLALIHEIQGTLPSLQAGLSQYATILSTLKELPPVTETARQKASDAIQANPRKFTDIKAPILAIIAVPHACAPNCSKPAIKALAKEDELRADAFAAGNPHARVVRLAYAKHNLYVSNEKQVMREMNAFIDQLNRRPGQSP